MAKFIGFSTVNKLSAPYTLTDVDLVKRDLLNELETRLGERVMKPEFGTIIYDLLMEPSDDITNDAIESDVIRIIEKDPRVRITEVTVTNELDFIAVEVSLLYVPQGLSESLYISYQKTTTPTGSLDLL